MQVVSSPRSNAELLAIPIASAVRRTASPYADAAAGSSPSAVWLPSDRGVPNPIRSDYGTELVAHALSKWLASRRSTPSRAVPGKTFWETPQDLAAAKNGTVGR